MSQSGSSETIYVKAHELERLRALTHREIKGLDAYRKVQGLSRSPKVWVA